MIDETNTDEPDQGESKLPAVQTKGSLVPLDPFTAYLQEVKKYPLLSADEEKELGIRYKETGDLESAYKLTTANLMLVIKIAMTFKREWQNLMDLIQEGNVGLMKAVKNFDPFRGVPLSAYATWWIKSYILKHILDNWRLVRVGTTNARRKLLFNLKKEKEKLEREGFDPTTKLLAERFGVDEGEVIDVSASIQPDPLHVGQSASFYTLALLSSGQKLAKNSAGKFKQINKLSSIPAFSQTSALAPLENFSILKNLKAEAFGVSDLTIQIFLGYSLDAAPGEIYFNGKAITLAIE